MATSLSQKQHERTKKILEQQFELTNNLKLDKAASVEISSENDNYPIESALLGGRGKIG